MISPTLTRSKSTGNLKLASKDPFTHPIIDPKYLTNEEDVNVLAEGHKVVKWMMETEAAKSKGLSVMPIKECVDKHGLHTEEYFKCLVYMCSFTVYHPVGTCKMGPKSDPQAVVDPTLKVHGVKRLRVIDASIMPKIVTGNTNAATVMIGERGVDFVVLEWKSSIKSRTSNAKSKDEL